jgi:hypothetical protein
VWWSVVECGGVWWSVVEGGSVMTSLIINIRHNYMHDITRSKSGGTRWSEEE